MRGLLSHAETQRAQRVVFEILRFWSSRCDRTRVVESSKEVCYWRGQRVWGLGLFHAETQRAQRVLGKVKISDSVEEEDKQARRV